MKITITKQKLLEALQKISKATPTRSTIPILNCVLFSTENKNLILRATDHELTMVMSIDTKIDEAGEIAIPYRTLFDITSAMPDTDITFTVDPKNKVTIQTNFGKYDIEGVSAEEFPSIPEVDNKKEVSLKPAIISRLIEKTTFALSADELKPALLGTLFRFREDEITSVATDGHKLSICSRRDYTSKGYIGDVIIPKKFLTILPQYLSSEEDTTLWVGENHVMVSFENLTIFSRIIDESYPDYRGVIPKENDKIVKGNREELIASVKRVSIFSNKSTKQIALHLSSEGSKITTEDPETASSAKEDIELEYNNEDLIIGYNAQFLIDLLSHIDTEQVILKLKTPISAGLVFPESQEDNEDLTLLIMPMRMSE